MGAGFLSAELGDTDAAGRTRPARRVVVASCRLSRGIADALAAAVGVPAAEGTPIAVGDSFGRTVVAAGGVG